MLARPLHGLCTAHVASINLCATYLRNKANMDDAKVLPFHPEVKLPERLHKRHPLNITNCTAQLQKYNSQNPRSRVS